jgi:hypothetical protein
MNGIRIGAMRPRFILCLVILASICLALPASATSLISYYPDGNNWVECSRQGVGTQAITTLYYNASMHAIPYSLEFPQAIMVVHTTAQTYATIPSVVYTRMNYTVGGINEATILYEVAKTIGEMTEDPAWQTACFGATWERYHADIKGTVEYWNSTYFNSLTSDTWITPSLNGTEGIYNGANKYFGFYQNLIFTTPIIERRDYHGFTIGSDPGAFAIAPQTYNYAFITSGSAGSVTPTPNLTYMDQVDALDGYLLAYVRPFTLTLKDANSSAVIFTGTQNSPYFFMAEGGKFYNASAMADGYHPGFIIWRQPAAGISADIYLSPIGTPVNTTQWTFVVQDTQSLAYIPNAMVSLSDNQSGLTDVQGRKTFRANTSLTYSYRVDKTGYQSVVQVNITPYGPAMVTYVPLTIIGATTTTSQYFCPFGDTACGVQSSLGIYAQYAPLIAFILLIGTIIGFGAKVVEAVKRAIK